MENLRSVIPGTVVKFEHYDRQNMDDVPQFKTAFLCFEAMKTGFLEGCRPFIVLDGCHLKGPYGSCALSAITLDGYRRVLKKNWCIGKRWKTVGYSS